MSSKDEGETQKKGGLETLSHDELVAKCKNLLSIAQRAKKARDEALEENSRFKQEIESFNSKESDMELQMDNMTKTIGCLTEQKKILTKQIEDIGKLNGNLKENLWDVRQELVALKERNEQLLKESENQKEQLNLFEIILNRETAIKEQLEADKLCLNDDLQKLTENTEQMKVICQQIAQERVSLEKELTDVQLDLSGCLEEKTEWNYYLSSKFPGEEFSTVKSSMEFLDRYLQNIRVENDKRTEKLLLQNSEENLVYDNEIEKLNLVINDLNSEKETLNNELVELKIQNNRLSETLDELNVSHDALLEKLDEVRIETQNLIENSEKLSEENSVLKSDKNKLDEELSNVLNEKARLNDENETIKIQNKELNVEIETVNKRLQITRDDNEKINAEYEILLADKETLVKEISDLKHSYAKVVEESAEWHQKYEEVIKMNLNLNDDIRELENIKSDNENKLKSYIGDLSSKTEMLEKLKDENCILNNNIIELQNNLKDMSTENGRSSVAGEMVSIKKELIDLIEFILSKSNQSDNENEIVEHVEDENNDLSIVLKSLKNSVNKLVEEKNSYKTRIKEFNNNIDKINSKILENEKVIENLKVEKQQVKDLLEEKVSENNNMIKSLENLKSELENISHHMKNSEKEKNEEIVMDFENLKILNLELLDRLKIFNAEKEKLSNELQDLSQENKNLLDENQNLLNEKENILKTLNKKIVDIEEKSMENLQRLNCEKDEINNDLREIKIEKDTSLLENERLINDNKNLIERIEKLNEKHLVVEENLKSHIDKNNILTKQCTELQNANKTLLKDIFNIVNNNLKLLSIDKEINENQVDGETVLNGLKFALELIKNEFSKKEMDIKCLQTIVNEKEENIKVFSNQNVEIIKHLNMFKNNLGVFDQMFLQDGVSIEDQEDCLKRMVDNSYIISELCDSYSDCFNVNKVEAVKCVKDRLNQLKMNKWLTNNHNTNCSTVRSLEQDLSWEVIQNKDRMKMEESQEDLSSETNSFSDEILKKDQEISELQDKVKELKTVAIKLKKKVTDLNQQLENERQKYEVDKNKLMNLTSAAKNAQTLQQECDRLADELEETKKKMRNIKKLCDMFEESETKLKQQVTEMESKLEAKDKELISLKNHLEISQASLHNLQKDQEEMLKEKVAHDVIVKELEKELTSVQETLKTTKSNLEQAKQESRKQSVLSLEMQDYEKSVKDLTAQISQEKDLVKQLEEELDSKAAVQNSLQEQIELLEKRVVSEEERANIFSEQLNQTRLNLDKAEKISMEKAKQMSDLMRQLETEKSNKDILALQLSDLTAENQKQIESTRLQNEALLNRVAKLESDLRCCEIKRTHSEEEMTRINKEFEAYKIRAQSVLRQRGGSAAEREAKEECIRLHELHNHTKSKLDLTVSELEKLKSDLSLVVAEKETLEKKCDNLNSILMQRNKELDRQINEHRSHKISTDTLIQCYKSQLEEKERGFQMELDSLREQLNKLVHKQEAVNSSTIEMGSSNVEVDVNRSESNDNMSSLPPRPPLIEREDGEGSEGNESSNYSVDNSRSYLVPLEKLLNSPAISEDDKDIFSSEKFENLRTEIAASNTRVRHLAALLSESEKDSTRKEEQIAVLKEEIRRLQRCIERQPHAHNTEYLKNIVFKFVTLHSGDERSRLVPVLDTILKLSPDEHRQLAAVARGESEQSSSWGLYLPSWPSLQS